MLRGIVYVKSKLGTQPTQCPYSPCIKMLLYVYRCRGEELDPQSTVCADPKTLQRDARATGKHRATLQVSAVRYMIASGVIKGPKPAAGNQRALALSQNAGAWSTDTQVRKTAWLSIMARACVPYRNPYQIRHTYASTLLTAGATPRYMASATEA